MKAKKTIISRTYYKWTFATFTPSSSLQEFSVPAGTKELIVDCVASKGLDDTSPGGKGGRVQCVLPVTPSSTLYFYVGAIPSTKQTPEYNASDIRTDNTGILDSTSLSSRLVVAGGGACGGTDARFSGGDGGGLTGGAGGTGTNMFGQGGTQTAGGAGGSIVGTAGTFGIGGTGSIPSTNNTSGGAGWYGGGGSMNAYTGGGGSSYTDPSCKAITHTQGYNDGSGYIKITYAVVSTADDYDYYEEEATYSLVNKPIGDKPVYYGVKGFSRGEVYAPSTQVGYTVVGSPTIVDGVASGFSSSDYLQLQKYLPVLTTTNNWEMGSKIITPASGDGIILGIATWYLNGLRYVNNGKKVVAQFFDYANGAYVEVSSGTLAPNTAYYIKTYCSGTNLVLAVSTDKQTWTEYTTALSSNFTTNPLDYHVHLIGGGGNYGTFGGSIDLNETYIFREGFCFFRGDMPDGKFI